jgi:hypothetical protein
MEVNRSMDPHLGRDLADNNFSSSLAGLAAKARFNSSSHKDLDSHNLYKRKFDAFWAFRRHKANLQVELKDNLVWVFDMIDDLG